ncbi:MAG: glycosyl hydrolase [Thermoguttaceae bacterium]|nr:glycosyl hydrolase [Thermoguttaceae bacterium]MDW8080100.1 glycosyl hydrolase [Thermoguttaceae bacterium]
MAYLSMCKLRGLLTLWLIVLPISWQSTEKPALAGGASCGESQVDLRQRFLSPEGRARPAVYWCWLNGFVDPEALRAEVAEFAEKGITGLYVFDIGARSGAKPVPAGPAFLSPQWLESLRVAVSSARSWGLEIGLVTSSSWNAGGPWIPPELASMGLYQATVVWEGPGRKREKLPLPQLPPQAPRDEAGRPLYYKDVAVLALPERKVRTTEFFVFRLRGTEIHLVDRALFYQAEARAVDGQKPVRPVKEFAVWVSSTSDEPGAFHLVHRGTLRPEPGPQEIRFSPVPARYAMLELVESYRPELAGFDLAEWELYTTGGENVVSAFTPGGTKMGAALLWWGSQIAPEGPGAAACVHDGIKDQPRGVWSSADPPPLVLENVSQVVDLTDLLQAEGVLEWDVPPGKWRIIRYGCGNTGQRLVLPSPQSGGLVLDHLNPQATEFHFRTIVSRLKEHLGPDFGGALRQLYSCSYEVRGATWTPKFLDEFRHRRGYDMRRYLPALDGYLIGGWEKTRRFLHDFRKTLGELLVDGFYRTAARVCHEEGLLLCAEAGGPGLPLHQVPVDALQAQGAIDIPRGEFWIQHDVWVVKETACAAHIYGKALVDMEAFTSWRHWQDGPWQLKPIADRAFVEGANRFTFHTAAHRPASVRPPGWVYHAGTHFSPHIAWWPLAKPFVDYIARCSAVLQNGAYVADVCYYYGDGGFKYVPPKHVDPGLGFGYDYDVCNEEVILQRAEVRDGKLHFGSDQSTGYEVLVLPESEEISPRVLARLAELVEDGLTLVGRRPKRSNSLSDYPLCDQRVAELADRLWGKDSPAEKGENRVGRGRVIWGKPVRQILRERNLPPDFWLESLGDWRSPEGKLPDHLGAPPIDYVHRSGTQADVYFVWNRTDRWQSHWVQLRSGGDPPELWDPVSGAMVEAPVYRRVGPSTSVFVQLPPWGSLFIVLFKEAAGGEPERVTVPPIVGVERNGMPVLINSSDEPPVLFMPVGQGREPSLVIRQPGHYRIFRQNGKFEEHLAELSPPKEVPGPWLVRFLPGRGAPPEAVFPTLIDWSQHPEPGIRYYSGVATYEAEFELSPPLLPRERLILGLGEVHFLAEVAVNGQVVGSAWTAPWEIDITTFVQAGKNKLVIRVANDWNNRLVGDALDATSEPVAETNMPWSISWRRSWKDTPLQRAGLIGPVTLKRLTAVPL